MNFKKNIIEIGDIIEQDIKTPSVGQDTSTPLAAFSLVNLGEAKLPFGDINR